MKNLFNILKNDEYSLVVKNGENIHFFKSRGVADLYDIIKSGSAILHNADVADKIIGKGAAALMIKGGIRAVITDVISEDALNLLKINKIKVEYNKITPYIINRAGDGRCPVESLCENEQDIDKIFQIIEEFLISIRGL